MKNIGRLVTAMVTPFNENNEVDYAQVKRLAAALVDSGSDGVVVSGTTGESPTLVLEEELELFRAVKEAIGERGSLIAGTGSNSTMEAVHATQEAEKLGVDACLLVVPYYNKPSQEGMYEHFKTIAQSTKLPCILYNVPSRTAGTGIAADTVIRLSRIENIIGLKESNSNFDHIAKVIAGVKEGFRVWSGNDNEVLPTLAIGGYGVISVASHLVGLQMKEMMESYLEGKVSKAAAIHRHLLPLINALFVVSNPVPIKYALNHLGFNVGKPRLPLVEPDPKSAEFIKETLKNYRIDLKV